MQKNTFKIVCQLCLIGLAFASSNSQARVFKCKTDKDNWEYSATPCAKDSKQVNLKITGSAGDAKNAAQDNTNPIVGEWTSSIHVYDFRAGGYLRDEQYYDGDLIVWRTGRWQYNDEVLTLKFTNSGGPLGGGSMNHSESGNVIWGEDQNSFKVRLDGIVSYFKRQ